MDPVQGTHFRNLSDTGQNISAGEIWVSGLYVINTSGAAAFVQIFNKAVADVILGTTRPLFVIPVAATTGVKLVAFDPPLRFDTRVGAFSTTTPEGLTGSAVGVFLQAFIQ